MQNISGSANKPANARGCLLCGKDRDLKTFAPFSWNFHGVSLLTQKLKKNEVTALLLTNHWYLDVSFEPFFLD
nr:hypothetical protein [Providencia stuartii]